MAQVECAQNSSSKYKKILIVGQAKDVFIEPDINIAGVVNCADMQQAIEAAEKQDFDLIGVVIGSFGIRTLGKVNRLRQIRPNAKIVLLSQMYEEPIAMEFIRANQDSADDYEICPVEQIHRKRQQCQNRTTAGKNRRAKNSRTKRTADTHTRKTCHRGRPYGDKKSQICDGVFKADTRTSQSREIQDYAVGFRYR